MIEIAKVIAEEIGKSQKAVENALKNPRPIDMELKELRGKEGRNQKKH